VLLIPTPTAIPLSDSFTSPPFRRLLCPYYILWCPAATEPPTWWSSYAAAYSPDTCHFCSQPASGLMSVLLPIPTTTTLSHPITSSPSRRLLCLYYGALQPAVTRPHHRQLTPRAPSGRRAKKPLARLK
jgi:hypothetical protein